MDRPAAADHAAPAPPGDSPASAEPEATPPHRVQLRQKLVERLNQMGLRLLAMAETVRSAGDLTAVSECLDDMAERLTMLEIAVAAIQDKNTALAGEILDQLERPNRPLM